MNPETILCSEETITKIDAVCRRRFSDDNDALECSAFIMDSLRESDYRRLRAFQGKSSFSTFLYALVHRLISEFCRKKIGRRRYPKAITDMGKWAEAVFRLICYDRFSFDEAYAILRIKPIIDWDYPEYEKRAEPIRRIPCPEIPTAVSVEALTYFDGMQASEPNPLESLLEKSDMDQRIRAGIIIKEITETLPESDQLLIRLVYGSDTTLTAAARVIGITPDAARKRLKRLLLKYKETLLAEGIRGYNH